MAITKTTTLRQVAYDASQEENAGHCDTWSLRDNSDPQSHEENHRLFGSPTGAMHAWTLMLHTLMTSYPYLYD